jgi:hypothetical protein
VNALSFCTDHTASEPTLDPVERGVRRRRERIRTIVDVEQDRVPRLRRVADRGADIADVQPHARIGERLAREVSEVLSVPRDDLRHELDDGHVRVRA